MPPSTALVLSENEIKLTNAAESFNLTKINRTNVVDGARQANPHAPMPQAMEINGNGYARFDRCTNTNTRFDPVTGQPIPKFDTQTGHQNW